MTTGGGQSRDAVVTIRYPVAAGRDGEHLPSHDVGNDAQTAAVAHIGFQIVLSVSASLGRGSLVAACQPLSEATTEALPPFAGR